MNFNKNKRNKEKKENSRFAGLKTDSNPFKSQSRGNSRNRSESTSDGSYVPPSKRNNQRGRKSNRDGNSFKGRRKRYTGVAPPEKKKEPEKIMPNINDKEMFPTLAVKNTVIEENNPWSKKLVVNSDNSNDNEKGIEEQEQEQEQENYESDNQEEKEVEDKVQDSWSTIIKRQDPKVKEDDPDFIKPGWVRLSYDKTLKRYVQEHGAEVPESQFYRELRLARLRKIQEEWEKRMQEYEEYDEYMGYTNNYYYSWQADEIDAERELEARLAKMEEEWEQQENASDDGSDSEDYEDYDYY